MDRANPQSSDAGATGASSAPSVEGVAEQVASADPAVVRLAGLARLAAGARSMAVGE